MFISSTLTDMPSIMRNNLNVFRNEIIFDTIISDFTRTFDMYFRLLRITTFSHRIVLFGGGNFSKHHPSDYFNTLYRPCLRAALGKLSKKPKSIGLMGNVEPRVSKGVESLLSAFDIPFRKLGNVPDILTDFDTLYQNAWDPPRGWEW